MATPLKIAYAVYPSVKLKGDNKKTGKFGFRKELLFGDFIKPFIKNNAYETRTVVEGKKEVTYIKVRTRGVEGYLKEENFQPQRILEVNFIDVGQGDGCHIVTPDDKHFLIDAGPSDNMYRFLKWRFNLNKANVAPPPFTVIVSHSDSDHYKGFGKVFAATKGARQQFSIEKIYHNGLVELSGAAVSSLGTPVPKSKPQFITDLCQTNDDFKERAVSTTKPGVYITTMNKSKAPKQSLKLGSPSLYKKGGLSMDILAPITEKINGKQALRIFAANKGKTKNGHSVVIKLVIGHLRLLLGGDLNTESEYHLLKHFSKVDVANLREQLRDDSIDEIQRKKLELKLEAAITTARKSLEVDIAKSCHHGSADFTSDFLKALNPIATVISSGDNEPHTHPRPDTLGSIGKFSRGERSLIFSTELARSTKEFVEIIANKKDSEKGLYDKIPASKKERAVIVYGMINLRSDGEKVIVAQKLERAAAGRNWDIHRLEWNKKRKEFEYISKHE